MSLILLLAGCGPKPREGADLPVPYDLRVKTDNHGAVVYWSIDRTGNRPISGYNVYLSEKPLMGLFRTWEKSHPDPYNHAPYPGDTDADITRESFEFTHLENGKTYYVSVRTVGVSRAESDPSEEVMFVPLAKGEFIISSNHSSKNGGYSFDRNTSTPARDPRCDIYLYAKSDAVGLSSPSRLSAGLRKTSFTKGNEKNVETTIIKTGDKLTVNTLYGRAEVTINRIDHSGYDATAAVNYVFYPAKSGN